MLNKSLNTVVSQPVSSLLTVREADMDGLSWSDLINRGGWIARLNEAEKSLYSSTSSVLF